MTRQLRPRKSKPDYASLASFNNDNDAGTSVSKPIEEDEINSGSDFEPRKRGADSAEDAEFDEDEDANFDGLDEDESMGMLYDPAAVLALPVPSASVSGLPPTPSAKKGKGKAKAASQRPSVTPSPAQTTKRQQYSLPTPSVHHRHRAVPLFADTTRVERLASPPKLFEPNHVVWTNNFTSSAKGTDRIQKAWGYNVAAGPLWELLEDRGWYKEGYKDPSPGDDIGEAKRRPRVHQGIRVKDGWEMLSNECVFSLGSCDSTKYSVVRDAASHVPTHTETTDESEFRPPPPPVTCYFGPFGDQKKHNMNIYDVLQLCTSIASNARIFELISCPQQIYFRTTNPAYSMPVHQYGVSTGALFT